MGFYGTSARTKTDLLGSTDTNELARSKIIARSTLELNFKDGTRIIRYHDTDIITFTPEGNTILNSGGFRTSTTKSRMNEYAKIYIWADKGNWYFLTNGEEHLFYDGITVDSQGNLLSESKELDKERINNMKKKIAAYVKLIDSLEAIPMPDNGDCWFCLMREVKTGKPLGDCTKDTEHLISHMEEEYLHGSIIFNAIVEAGYRSPQLIMHACMKDAIKRALRKYLMKRLLPDVATH